MPTFQVVFSSVVDVYIEADDLNQAITIASDYDTKDEDWNSNVAVESVEEVEE